MPPMSQKSGTPRRKQYWLNLTLAGAAGQVGCVTLVIIIVAILGGMWLDARFQTRPVFMFVLLIASIPVSLVAMLYIVRLFTSKIKSGPPGENTPPGTTDESREED
jgi:MFS-type transporter involved in bile tolerance (Atg22 family)